MNKFMTLLALSMGVPALAATYTVQAGSSAATIQAIVNTAGSAAGNTVMFSAGSYSLTSTVTLPCSNSTLYTGPNVGVVTQANMPSAILTSTVTTNYALRTNSNGTSFTGNQGCTIQYLRFSGTQGGIYVTHPSSGIVIQYNYFTLNDPPVGGGQSLQAIYLDGNHNSGSDPSTGASYISILWNVFYNNCARINAEGGGNGNVDSGGYCAATIVSAYNNHLVWNNNTVNSIEEGLKLIEQGVLQQTSMNADVENNNMQGNSRIMIETQQDTNGVGVYSHNAFYEPNNPNNYTFELSMPEFTPSASPTHIADDNVYIGDVPITGETGWGAHYGIGLELWGAGSVATNSLFQGGNGPESCGAGYGCSGWNLVLGEPFTNATITGNHFSGSDAWRGSANDFTNAVSYEDNASPANPGLAISSNTLVATSAPIPTVAPTITPASSSSATTITLSDSDTAHRLSIFYTTDGTMPAIFGPGGASGTTKVYSAPFTVAPGTTVKAIASWGQGANQGIVFPSFGYVPSNVVTLSTGAAAATLSAKRITSGYLRPESGANTMTAGSNMQMVAHVTYSDGSTGTLPDAQGNVVTWWNTTNHAVSKIGAKGYATALAAGSINMEAMVGSLEISPWAVTVQAAASSSTAKRITSGYLRPESGTNTMTPGSNMQMVAHATYSDGSTGTLPDAQGNVVTWWNTTNHAVAKIAGKGYVTALAPGSIQIEAMIGPLTLTSWPVIVGAAPAPAAQSAPVAAAEASPAAHAEAAVTADEQFPATGNQTPPTAGAQASGAAVTPSGPTALIHGPVPAAPGTPLPDTFVGPFWRLVTPAGGSASISNGHLFIGVPGGGNHDPLLPSNQAVRVVQAIGKQDFDVAVKVDSPLVATDGDTSQGLMVLGDDEDFLTFAVVTNGTTVGLNARIVNRGVATTVLDDPDLSSYQNPMYLRLLKAGSAYVAFYSVDGVSWAQATSFTDTTVPTSIGLFASNYDDTPANAPPVVMSVNWFDVQQ